MNVPRRLTPLLSAAVGAAVLAGAPAARAALRSSPPRPRGNTVAHGPTAAQLAEAEPVPGSMGIPEPEPVVTVNMQRKVLGAILFAIFKQTPYTYRLLPETGTQLFTLQVDHVPLTRALTQLLAQDKSQDGALVYRFEKSPRGGGAFTIDRQYLQVGMVEGEPYVSLVNARLTDVLPLVFDQLHQRYRIEADVPPVPITLQLRPRRWDTVLPQVLYAADAVEPTLGYSKDGNTYVVHLHKIVPEPIAPDTPAADIPPGSRRVPNFRVQDMPLRDALAALFKGSKLKYQVADTVRDTRVTYAAADEAEITILQAILKQVSATSGNQVTYREGAGNVLYIEPGALPGEFLTLAKAPEGEPVTSYRAGGPDHPLSEVVRILASGTHSTVTIAPNVPDLAVPADFKVEGQTMAQALQTLVNAMKPRIPGLIVRSAGGGGFELLLSAR